MQNEEVVSVDQLLMTKACEVFLKDLTNLALLNAKEKNERIVKPCDVIKAVTETDRLDFLMNVVFDYIASDVKLGFEHEKENVENILDTNQHNAGNVLQGNQQLNVGDFINIGNDDALRHADGFLENPMYMVNGNEGMELDYRNVENFLYGNHPCFPHDADSMENPIMNMGNEQVEPNQELLQPLMMQQPCMSSDQPSESMDVVNGV